MLHLFELTDLYNANLNEVQQVVVFWLIFLAFCCKITNFPLHNWQPDTYTFSPTQGTMLLSGIMLKMAIYGVLRYLLPIAPTALLGTSGQVVMILSILGVVYGRLLRLYTMILRKLSLTHRFHVGLMVAGIFCFCYSYCSRNFTFEGAQEL